MTTFEKPAGVLLRRNVVPPALALLACAGSIGLMQQLAARGLEGPWMPGFSLLLCAVWIFFGVVWSKNAWAHRREGALVVSPDGVALDGKLVVPASDIVTAAYARLPWGDEVIRMKLRGRVRHELLRVQDEAEARTVLAALGRDAAHARASFVLPWRPFRSGTGLAFYLYMLFVAIAALMTALVCSPGGHGDMTLGGGLAGSFVGVAMVAAFWRTWWLSRQKLTVGTDGILIAQWGRTRFVPWNEIESIDPWPATMIRGTTVPSAGFDLVLRSGRNIGFSTELVRQELGLYTHDVVAERLREAMNARSKDPALREPQLPSREGRDAGAWLSDLRRAAVGAGDLRTPATDSEALWRVVEDPDAEPATRAAAAAALTAARDEPTRVRLRVTAATVAAPGLRAAMDAAADGDDDELARALDGVGSS